MDMSKSMSDIKVSPVELKPIPKPYKTPPNELDKAPPIKSKPVVPSLSSVNRHPIGKGYYSFIWGVCRNVTVFKMYKSFV